jgi:hypothetical protein
MVDTSVREQPRLGIRCRPSPAAAIDPVAIDPAPIGSLGADALRGIGHVLDVLEAARAVIERGWLRNGWYIVDTPPRSAGRRLLRPDPVPVPDDIGAACLVAAVAVAAHSGGSRPDVVGDAGPVIDIVWDTLQESMGRSGPGVSGRPAPSEVRVSRMRDLVRWNDAPGRTRQDVLNLVDRSISRTILAAMGRA